MGLVAKILNWVNAARNSANVSDVKVYGHGTTKTATYYGPLGDDSQALPGDYAFVAKNKRSGDDVVVAYVDPLNDQQAGAGEKIIYGRDSNGARVNYVWLKNTGEFVIANDNATLTVTPAGEGTWDLTSLTINAPVNINDDFTLIGNYDSTGTMTNNSQNVGNTHGHTQANDGAGDTEAPIIGVT